MVNNSYSKPKKITKSDRIIMLRKLLENSKKIGQEPDVTEIAKYLSCTRQTLYYDKDYSDILKEFEIGKRFKKNTVASKEYLIDRIASLEADLNSKDNKIKKLYKKIADLETENKEVETALAKEKKRLLCIQIYYLHLIEVYNSTAKGQISVEPYDLQNLEIDPLDILFNSEDKNKNSTKIIPISKN